MAIPDGTAPVSQDPRARGGAPWGDLLRLEPLATSESACCCTARPVVRVLLAPVAPGGDPAELLLCGHHVRACWQTLEAAGAVVFNAAGRMVMPKHWEPAPSAQAMERSPLHSC